MRVLSRPGHRGVRVCAAAAFLVAAGCVTYSATNLALRPELAAGRFNHALASIGRETGSTNRLLRLLEQGQVLHLAGRFAESNAVFQQAEDLADALYSRSVSRAAVSLITNDTTISYRAEPFELAMVPYYRAFNYISLGEWSEAVVEARKASELLARAAETTLAEIGDTAPEGPEHRIGDNAFLHHLAGMLYESNGETNDAYIAYSNAARAYVTDAATTGIAPPPWLAADLGRTARRLGFARELAALAEELPSVFSAGPAQESPDAGHVVLIVESGWVAHKDQVVLNLPILSSDHTSDSGLWAAELAVRAGPGWVVPTSARVDYWLTVAMPTMAPPPPGESATARISVPAAAPVAAVPVDDLSRRALATFSAKRPKILVKTIVRALTKYAATRAAERRDEVAGVLVNIFGALTERADTRSWLTLPGELAMARLSLPAGRHELSIQYLDGSGRVLETETIPVEVAAGGWTFLSRRLF
jgi:uncharacterized protein